MKAVILSAGEGTRMRPLTLTKPKTMLPVAGKPIIQYNIEALRDCGVKDILLIVGYKEEIVRDYFKDGQEFGVNISYATQSKLEGTADAIGYGKDFIEDSLIILNGDIILDVDIINEIIEDYEKSKPDTFVSVKKSHDVPRKKEINAIPSIHVPPYTTGNNSFIFFFPDGTSV